MSTVIVTGGRDFTNARFIRKVLDHFPCTVVVGDCPTGVDRIVRDLYHHICFKADWKQHGRAAGPIRNRMMLEAHPEALVVAFPGGRGTADCVRQARGLGMPVLLANLE